MKALAIHQYGGPEQLQIIETALPIPGRGEVLVRVHAAGVNPVDYKIRNGSLKWLTGRKFPKILGGDIAGTVETAGKTSPYKPGDKVFAMLGIKGGAYAEFVVAKEKQLCHIPEGLDMTEAAATPLAALTAMQGLQKGDEIKTGDKILVNGASGGVGAFAVQIAKAMGAHVTGVCSKKNIEFVKSLGADDVIDYAVEDFTASKTKFNKVLDAVAKSSFSRCKPFLTDQGTYITTLPGPGIMLHKAFNFLRKKKAASVMVKPLGTDLAFLAGLIKKGLLKAHIEQTFPLAKGAAAHELLETERVRGKLVLTIID